MVSKICRVAIALLIVSGVIGCSWLPEVKEETTSWSAEKLYEEAHGAMLSGKYARGQAVRYSRALSVRPAQQRSSRAPQFRQNRQLALPAAILYPHLSQSPERRLRYYLKG
jgi:outer membrane protein assembly factor BamD (BamD/ComL family)